MFVHSQDSLMERNVTLFYRMSSTQDARAKNCETKYQQENNTNPEISGQEHVMNSSDKIKNDY